MISCENYMRQEAIDEILRARNRKLGEILYEPGTNCCLECKDAGNPDPIKDLFNEAHGCEVEFHRVCYKAKPK